MRAEMGYVSEGAAGLSFSEYDCEKRETSQKHDSCSTDISQADTTQTYPTKKQKQTNLKTTKRGLLNMGMLMHLDTNLLGLPKR